jgi:hypothetical protein
MPFSDPIVAGETLTRSAISSPNYVQATSGWTVTDTGFAEFEDLYIRGPGGRYVRIYLDPNTLIPVMDFHPPTPANGAWSVDAGSVYTYPDANGNQILGLSSPNQRQPAATGEALLELRSGRLADPTTAILTTSDYVVIYGPGGSSAGQLLHGPEFLSYMYGQRGTQLCTFNLGTPTGDQAVTFPTPFAVGVVPTVVLNIDSWNSNVQFCRVHATAITRTGFNISAEGKTAATDLTWTDEPVSWLAFAD